jgi:hypothetical protein
VVKAGREFELLRENSLGERIIASPAVSGNELFYRNRLAYILYRGKYQTVMG